MPHTSALCRQLLGLSLVLILASEIVAQDDSFAAAARGQWHQFRGPEATGASATAQPPITWSETENVRWKVALPGPGSSTPIVWGDRVFILASRRTDEIDPNVPPADDQPDRPFGIKFENHLYEFLVVCYDRDTGNVLWERVATKRVPFQGHHPDNNFASGSPTTDGERLYVPFGSQGYYCYDLDGNLLWERDLGPVETRLSFGEGASLTVHGDNLIIVRDNEQQSSIEVLATDDGTTRWRQDRDEPTSWATPVVVEHGGRTLVITNATNRVRAYDLADGTLVWSCGGQVTNVTPSPVVNDELAFCASGYRGSILQAIPLDSQGDLTDQDALRWALDRGTPYIPSLLLYRDQLYFTASNAAILSSVRAEDGTVLIDRERLPLIRSIYASPVAADGRVYLFGRDGEGLVLEAGETLKILAENQLEARVDASPALVGKQMFIRSLEHLYCLEAPQ